MKMLYAVPYQDTEYYLLLNASGIYQRLQLLRGAC